MINIKSLENVGLEELYKSFALAFEDYEFQVNYEGFKGMLKQRGYDSVLSFAAFDGDRIVSFVLNGVGNFKGILTAYDTGTGTIKEFRGQGVTSSVFEYSVPKLKSVGIKQYLLEVLQHNEKAVSLYKKQGFETVRELSYSFKKCGDVKLNAKENLNFTIREITIEDENQVSGFWDFVPSWQNSLDCVKRAGGGYCFLGAFSKDVLAGYTIFEKASGYVKQMAVDKAYRRKGAATLLLKEIMQQSQNGKLSFVNIDTSCGSMTEFLKSKNITENGRQFEMIKPLI